MNYVIAGYTIVLSLLFLYSVQLVWRRRRLARDVARVWSSSSEAEPAPEDGVVQMPANEVGVHRDEVGIR